jgi:hypothetical protein
MNMGWGRAPFMQQVSDLMADGIMERITDLQ